VRWTRQSLQKSLRERGLQPKKSLGQNFLVDENFLSALARDTGASKRDLVIEIGSGPGNLTDHLARIAGHVWAFEVDEGLHALSGELLAGLPNVTRVLADGAEFGARVEGGGWGGIRVVSNLPYFAWERLLLAMLSARLPVLSYTIMLQVDLYRRLRSGPGTKEYGPMPALLQAACGIRLIRRAGRGLFLPVPRVDSVVFELVRRERIDFAASLEALRGLFAHRRKKSASAGGRRVEQLAPGELLDLVR
jgi:16S rRNA (adenine1518-N6/adenine1519-N6)-dimethyltransferase